MMTDHPDLQEMTKELLALLDEELSLLQLRTTQFDRLYEAVLHRDDSEMEQLLVEMTDTQQTQAAVDVKLLAVRRVFASLLRLDIQEIKLSMLSEYLTGQQKIDLTYKRQQVIVLAEQLKRKHLDTAMLLTESARLNRMLLEGLLPKAETVTTYGSGGAKPWHSGTGLVDTEI